MAVVIHELVTNARKHGALTSPTGRVIVTTTPDEVGGIAMGWHEAGGPPVRPPTRRGFGSTILEQTVPFECNGTCASSYHADGFRWDMTHPAGFAACTHDEVATTACRERHAVDDTELAVILRQTLIVEDNLFIAFDAEDIMRTLGAGTIEVVKSVAAALDAIAQRRFTFALLDVNLGAQTSLPVALALREAGIPFAFATGYRQALGMPASLADVAIVSKPYNRHAVGAMLMRLLPDRPDAPAARTQPQLASAVTTFREVAAPAPREAASLQDVVRHRQPDVFSRRLAGLAVLSSDDEAAIAEVSSQARAMARKTDIVRQGARPDGLYVVLAGFACRFRLRRDGSRQITSYLLPGDALDLSEVPESMTDGLGMLSDCRVATLSRATAAILKSSYPRIAAALMSSAHVDQAVAREWLVSLGRRSAEKRFAHLFCELLVRLKDVGLVEHDAFMMPLTQFDLADTLGLSVVHVNRTLQLLRQRGLFVWKGKVVTILDRPGLLKLAEFDPRYLRYQPDVTGAPARAAKGDRFDQARIAGTQPGSPIFLL